jgi:two-component system sensor histidine kinase BaeS
LIDELLLLARGDSERESSVGETVDARALVREAAAQATAMGAGKNVRVHAELQSDALLVHGDEVKLRRLLLILVDNAVKFTPDGGRVTLTALADGDVVTISVADTGAGISAEDLPHIFERFWRADKVRSRDVSGAGLGLPIARQIAEQHGARLDVQSELGRGSCFTLQIPRVFTDTGQATVA